MEPRRDELRDLLSLSSILYTSYTEQPFGRGFRMNQFVSDAKRHLASTSDISTTLQRVARAAVPSIADFCLIFIAKNGTIPCAAFAHCTDDGRRVLRALNRTYKITRSNPSSTVAHVLRCGRPELRSDIDVEPRAPAADVRAFNLHRRLGTRSALVVPIGSRPDVLGALSLCFGDSGRRYSAEHLGPALDVATLIAAFLRTRGAARPLAHVPVFGRRSIRPRARV